MKPIWTEQAILGWKEVATYILRDFVDGEKVYIADFWDVRQDSPIAEE